MPLLSFQPRWSLFFSSLFLLIGLAAGSVPLAAADLPAPVLLGGGNAATAPALFPFLPVAGKTTGGAVVIVPEAPFTGGGVDGKSVALARWLADRGMASFVLRYGAPSAGTDRSGPEVKQALQAIRGRAAEFKVAADRVGVLGLGRGAEMAADSAYGALPESAEGKSARPAFVALVWGDGKTASVPADASPTFLVGSTLAGDDLSGLIDLWGKLRSARVSVDAHFFAKSDRSDDVPSMSASPVSWPEMFYAWVRFQGIMAEQPRLALKGMAYLDGHPLPQGYVIFTPIDFIGAGPIIARVINSTANDPIGEFEVPAGQGPVPGRYKVAMHQNMNRWLSNAFSGALVSGRGGMTPEKAYFGHHRVLSPSIDDQRVYTKKRPSDAQEYIIEFKADAPANTDLKIEVFTK